MLARLGAGLAAGALYWCITRAGGRVNQQDMEAMTERVNSERGLVRGYGRRYLSAMRFRSKHYWASWPLGICLLVVGIVLMVVGW